MNQNFCPTCGMMQFFEDKWKMPLMFVIQVGPMRFGQLKRALNSIAEQMLVKLRELEKHNFIERKDYKTVPSKVEYDLTDFGRFFTLIIRQFQILGINYKKKIVAVAENE